MASNPDYVVLGAGVIGLTTAIELQDRHPESKVAIIAKFWPGEKNIEYASPWAGANWMSFATDNGPQEQWDERTFNKFSSLVSSNPECGVQRMPLTALFDSAPEEAGILSEGTGKIWYEQLVGGFKEVEGKELKGAVFGYEMGTFMIEVPIYLGWLQNEVLKRGIEIRRRKIDDIDDVFKSYPVIKAVFNCTGLGSYSLKGVEDKSTYPTRGQTILIETPTTQLTRMYVRSPKRIFKDTCYVFPRNPGGGIILGGCRIDGVWDGEVDMDFAEDIKKRCCELAPELGRPEELRVLSHGVGLRPSREGGARIEREVVGSRVVVHNYGAGGGGYQGSWGMAKDAVDLLQKDSKL